MQKPGTLLGHQKGFGAGGGEERGHWRVQLSVAGGGGTGHRTGMAGAMPPKNVKNVKEDGIFCVEG